MHGIRKRIILLTLKTAALSAKRAIKMKTLDLIRFITINQQFTNIVVMDKGDATPMQAICELARIDQSNDFIWKTQAESSSVLLVWR